MTTTRLDHLVYAVPDLDTAIADLADRLGVAPLYGGRHDGFGTHNALLGLGERVYLELLAPDPTQAVPPPFAADSPPTLVGWAASTTDIDATVSAARAAGYDPGDPVAMQRTRPDGIVLHWRLTPPLMDGSGHPFLIDWADSPHPADAAPRGVDLVRFAIEHPQPAAARAALSALGVDVPVDQADAPALVAVIRGDGNEIVLR